MQRCPTPHQGTCKRFGSFQGWRGGKGDLENCRYLGKNARYAPAFPDFLLSRLAPSLGSRVRMCTTLANLGRTKPKVTISFICMKNNKRQDKGDREGIPHTYPIPWVIRLELFLESE